MAKLVETSMKCIGWARGCAVLYALATGSAMAADLSPILKAPPAPVSYSWTGCHAGIEGGGAWGSSQHIDRDPRQPAFAGVPLTNDFGVSGGLLGGTLGCDYQVDSRWAVGIENDMSWVHVDGSAHLIPPFVPAADLFETKVKWLDTLRVRAGYTWDRWYVYGTGGAAFSEIGINLCSPLALTCGSGSKTVTGWTAGVGAEYAFRPNWSAKLEYLHVDLGTTLFPALPDGSGRTFLSRDVKLTNDIVRAGVNYKFDWFLR